MRFVKRQSISKILILTSLVLLMFGSMPPFPAQAITDLTGFTTIVPSGVTRGNNAVVTENNDIYLMYNDNMVVKYTYATGTWGTPVQVKVGGVNKSTSGAVGQSFLYHNGIFHLVYTSGTYIYYTASTDPFNYPAATQVTNNGGGPVLNIRSDGRIAIYYQNSDPHKAMIFSNYSGSFQTYDRGFYGYDLYLIGAYFSNDNNIVVYRDYSPDGDGSYTARLYTDYYTWDGSTWTGSPSTTYQSGVSFDSSIFPYARYVWSGFFDGYYYGSVERAGSVLFRTNTTNSSSYYSFYYGNLNGSISKSNTRDNYPIIKKLNNPDGRLVFFNKTYSTNMYQVAFLDYFAKQELTVSAQTTNSIDIRHTQGNNPNFVTTRIRISQQPDMSVVEQTKTIANSGGTSTVYTTPFTGLLPSTRYYFQSEVDDGLGRNKYSAVIDHHTLPAVPGNLTVSNVGSTTQTLSWSINQNGPTTTYYLERSLSGNPSGSDWTVIYSGPGTTYTDTELTAKSTYYYRVRAKNGANVYSDYTPIVSSITLEKDNVPPTASLVLNKGNSVLYEANLPVKIVVGDNRISSDAIKYSYSINNGAWSAPVTIGASSGVLEFLVPHGLTTSGDINFQLRVIDDDNNAGITGGIVYYQKPSELPTEPTVSQITAAETGASLSEGTLNGQPVYFNKSGSVVLDLSTQVMNQYQVAINNGDYGRPIAKTIPADIYLGDEGLHTVRIRQVNSAGIGGTEKVYRFVVDYTPPAAKVRLEVFRTLTSSASANLIITASDRISSSLKYRINAGAWLPLPGDGRVSASLSLGFNNIVVDVADEAGNYATQSLSIWRA